MKSMLLALPLVMSLAADPLPPALALKTSADAFLASLDEPKRAKAQLPFKGDERENWHYTPRPRVGLPLKLMTEGQKNAAVALATTAFSEKGALKAAQIITLESVLAELEKNPEQRDQENYFLTIFGTPGEPGGWGFRFEGHHLSVNITIAGDKGISVTPSFMGSNPAKVQSGELEGMRPLAAEEDLARALAVTLLESGHKEVIFSKLAPGEILSGEKRVATQLEAVGLLASEMTPAQRVALIELISEYTGRYREQLAIADLARIKQAGIENIRFGWAGSVKPGEAYYYRIQGPTFLMEAANTQNDANHMHSVWRDFKGDFARDLLKTHLDEH